MKKQSTRSKILQNYSRYIYILYIFKNSFSFKMPSLFLKLDITFKLEKIL